MVREPLAEVEDDELPEIETSGMAIVVNVPEELVDPLEEPTKEIVSQTHGMSSPRRD